MKYTNTINLLLLIVILSIHLQARAADKIDFTNPLATRQTTTRKNWRQTVDKQTALRETLQMVISSIRQ